MSIAQSFSLKSPIAILGYGVEGRSTHNYLLKHGIKDVAVLDAKKPESFDGSFKLIHGADYLSSVSDFKTIFRSPGIRPDLPQLVQAQKRGSKITSAVNFFMEYCPCPVIGVTGTLGKGTSASLAASALSACGLKVHLGGNIGTSPLDFLDNIGVNDVTVLEISSFQAMDLSLSPHISCILKTTSEHLDWHKDRQEYINAKAQMLKHQSSSDFTVYNADSKGASFIAQASKGTALGYSLDMKLESGLYLEDKKFVYAKDGQRQFLPLDIDRVRLKGRFNLENIAAAILMGLSMNLDAEKLCYACSSFSGLPHRLELCAKKGTLCFFNDSYATRPDSTLGAVSSFEEPLALILGGSEKYADFSELVDFLNNSSQLKYLALIGQTAPRLDKLLQEKGFQRPRAIFSELKDAVFSCVHKLDDKGIVLLSPACASFGMFKNYKDRGEKFKKIARQICSD